MKCPFCGKLDTKVIDTRTMEDNTVIRRRRFCDSCEGRFTTYERIDTIPLTVIKSDNTRETFNRDKITNGILISCSKRPVSREQIDNIVTDIENSILNTLRKEVASKEIGEMVMERLKEIDEVAYVRFASVYRQFTDVDSFMNELGKLLKDKK